MHSDSDRSLRDLSEYMRVTLIAYQDTDKNLKYNTKTMLFFHCSISSTGGKGGRGPQPKLVFLDRQPRKFSVISVITDKFSVISLIL
jgi:hypothetical protein